MTHQDTKNRFVTWFQKWFAPTLTRLHDCGPVPSTRIDDLAQAVFARLHCLNEERLVEDPQNHLFLLAHSVESELGELNGNKSQLKNALANKRTSARVRAAVARLPARQRELLQLHLDGKTHKMIAVQQDLTYRIVMDELKSAYVTLRMELRKDL